MRNTPALGEIQPDGSFSLEIPRVSEGAEIGDYKIWIAYYKSQNPKYADLEIVKDRYLLPQKYQSPEESGLAASITSNGENRVTFKL